VATIPDLDLAVHKTIHSKPLIPSKTFICDYSKCFSYQTTITWTQEGS